MSSFKVGRTLRKVRHNGPLLYIYIFLKEKKIKPRRLLAAASLYVRIDKLSLFAAALFEPQHVDGP